jgi:ubiquinol-cytochrome c reductase cytochrome b subunit
VQINPVWIYGPFHPAQATSPAQPDWYVAWGDGALRLFPPIEVHIAGHLIPAPFFPAVGLGTVTFLLLYAWPWLERWRTGDKASHQILDRPRDRPGRVAVGAYALTFFAVLLVAAADDIIARLSGIPVLGILRTLQILLLGLPFAVAAVAFLVARSLRAGTATTVGELTREDVHAGMTDLEEPPGETDHSAERIRLWRNPDDTWRWRWHAPSGDLASNEVFLDRQEALDAARTAFPGVPVEQDEPPEGVVLPPPRREPGPATKVAAALVWVAMAVLGRRADRRRPSRSEVS